MTHFRSIQVLRAVAALLVVAFHIFPGRFVIGAAGVDVFFVISGFIMGTIGPGESPRSFVFKRVIRIVPLYWAVTLAMCVASLVPGLFSTFTFDAARLAQSLLFIPHVDPSGQIWPLVVVGWTLNFEVFFYAVFALGLALRAPIGFTIAAMGALVALGLLLQPEAAPLRVWTHPLLLEFAAGLVLARATGLAHAGLGLGMMVLGVAGLAAAGILGLYDPAIRLAAWGLPALLIVSGALSIERAGRWPSALRPLEVLGDASYSLYLLHGLVIAFVHKLIGEDVVATAIILAVSIAAAILSFNLFEKPAARLLRRLAMGPPVPRGAGRRLRPPSPPPRSSRRSTRSGSYPKLPPPERRPHVSGDRAGR